MKNLDNHNVSVLDGICNVCGSNYTKMSIQIQILTKERIYVTLKEVVICQILFLVYKCYNS